MTTENDTQHDPLSELLLAAVSRDQVDWKPENVNDTVSGTVVELDKIETKYGTSPVVVLFDRKADREHRVPMFGTMLRDASAHIGIGDLVAIRYLGRVQGRQETPYKAYRIVVLDQDGNPKGAPGERSPGQPKGGTAPTDPVDELADDEEPF